MEQLNFYLVLILSGIIIGGIVVGGLIRSMTYHAYDYRTPLAPSPIYGGGYPNVGGLATLIFLICLILLIWGKAEFSSRPEQEPPVFPPQESPQQRGEIDRQNLQSLDLFKAEKDSSKLL